MLDAPLRPQPPILVEHLPIELTRPRRQRVRPEPRKPRHVRADLPLVLTRGKTAIRIEPLTGRATRQLRYLSLTRPTIIGRCFGTSRRAVCASWLVALRS